MNSDSLLLASESYPVVSLDVFDTALLRTVLQPSDIFRVVASQASALLGDLSPEAFTDVRIEADRRSRQAGASRHESTLVEIYAQVQALAGLSAPAAQELMALEIAVEREHVRPNPYILAFCRACLERGQRVIFISDMYLPSEVIRQMLLDSGYPGASEVFVSCEFGQTKREGTLYRRVLAQIGVQPGQVIHIGDSRRTDVESARRHGIATWHYPAVRAEAARHIPHLPVLESSLGGSYMGALIANRRYADRPVKPLTPDAYWEHFGYVYVGPLYYGFMAWLVDQLQRDRIERLYFLAREGFILQQVYRRFAAFANLNIPHHYLYASRRLYMFPLITEVTPESLQTLVKKRTRATVADFLESNGLNPEAHAETIRAHGFSGPEAMLERPADYDRLLGLLLALEGDLMAHIQGERDILQDYLRGVGFGTPGRAAVVDVGWRGTMQEALVNLSTAFGFQADICGYYLASLTRHATLAGAMRGYLIDNGAPAQGIPTMWEGIYLFEFMHAAPHPSIIRLRRCEGQISPVHMTEPEDPAHQRIISIMQKAALAFVDDMLAAHGIHAIPPETFLRIYERLLFAPTLLEAQMLGDLHHTESQFGLREVSYIARPSLHTNNPLKLIHHLNEYRAAHWKAGYLKRSKANPAYKAAFRLIRQGWRLWERLKG